MGQAAALGLLVGNIVVLIVLVFLLLEVGIRVRLACEAATMLTKLDLRGGDSGVDILTGATSAP